MGLFTKKKTEATTEELKADLKVQQEHGNWLMHELIKLKKEKKK